MTEEALAIGEVAKRTGVSVQALRYYERRGLIAPPARRLSGYRAYAPAVVRQVHLIRWAQDLGFRLGEITDLMRLARRHGGAPPRAVCHKAAEKIREIDDTLRRLRARKRSLTLIAQCRCRGDCPILEKAVGKGGET